MPLILHKLNKNAILYLFSAIPVVPIQTPSMTSYHGTNNAGATAITTPPSGVTITHGGGELGRGFYTGESIALAMGRAVAVYGKTNAKVVRFEIPDADFLSLHIHNIHKRGQVNKLWRSLLAAGTTGIYTHGCDVMCAPFATIHFSYQYKFESTTAGALLNNTRSLKTIIP